MASVTGSECFIVSLPRAVAAGATQRIAMRITLAVRARPTRSRGWTLMELVLNDRLRSLRSIARRCTIRRMRRKSEDRSITASEAGRRGGRSRAAKYGHAQLSAWARLPRLGRRKVRDVQALLADRRKGLTLAALGERYGVDPSTVARILRRHQAASVARPATKRRENST